ncbi:reverse transcriptase domain-containing protein [Tanacetum coccineum]
MSSATSAVTYTSVYTNFEPGRAFWGADDEEISEGGIPRVIVLGYDGLPMQPVAPPSPDYIPGPEDPQTPLVPHDEDEHEPMFVQAHDPDYVLEPIYPEYIPLEDDHEFPAEEQPLPPVDLPTTESPGYVTESDPEEDPEEYEDDETEDGPVDYPMDGGDDGDDDDGDSSRDDANDEDEDEEEEEHLAPVDSTIVVPVDEPIFPPEGTEPVIPPPSTDITIGARITVRPQTSISLPPKAEVERLLAMTSPSPSPPISLSPPSAGERLVRSMAPPIHLSPLPMPSPLLPSSGCPTQIQTLMIASTQALIDTVTAVLPVPPLPPSLYIPPPIDHRDEILESEQPPRKRLCLSTLGSRYEVGESSTARPTRGRGIDYGFVSTVDAEERVTELAELHEHDTQDMYALLEDTQDSRSRISQRVDMDSQQVDLLMGDRMTLQETTHRDHVHAYETHLQAHQTQLQLQSTLIQTQHQAELLALRGQQRRVRQLGPEARVPDHQDASRDADNKSWHLRPEEDQIPLELKAWSSQQAEMAALRETGRRRQAQMVETLRVMRDMRREMGDMQTELLALRGQRRARQPAPDARIPDHQDASGDADSHCQPLNFNRTEGVVGLTRWIEKMESVFNISGCTIENQVKFATRTLLGAALTWWNGQIRTLGPEHSRDLGILRKRISTKYCPQGEIKKLEIKLWNLKVKGNDVPAYTECFQELTLICTKFVANETEKVDKYISGLPDNIYRNVKSARPKTLNETIKLAKDLMDQKLRTYAERQSDNIRKADDSSRNNHGHQQQPFKK